MSILYFATKNYRPHSLVWLEISLVCLGDQGVTWNSMFLDLIFLDIL